MPSKKIYQILTSLLLLLFSRAWFVNRPRNDKAAMTRTQRVTEPGKGTRCTTCSEHIFGNEEVMMGHYAFNHDR